jgi:hypothetical protein
MPDGATGRAAAVALAAVSAVGALVLVVSAAGDDRRLAFTLGVQATQPAAQLEPGQQACQEPIDVAEEFSSVALKTSTFGRPGPPLAVRVVDANGRTVSRGRRGGGYADGSMPIVPVRAVPERAGVAVCVRNAGRARVDLLGGAPQAARASTATVGGRPVPADLTLVFLRRESRSALSLVPEMFERATLFHPGWVGTWTFWTLLVLVGAGVPLLMWLALRTVLRASGEVW